MPLGTLPNQTIRQFSARSDICPSENGERSDKADKSDNFGGLPGDHRTHGRVGDFAKSDNPTIFRPIRHPALQNSERSDKPDKSDNLSDLPGDHRTHEYRGLTRKRPEVVKTPEIVGFCRICRDVRHFGGPDVGLNGKLSDCRIWQSPHKLAGVVVSEQRSQGGWGSGLKVDGGP